uniref:Putative secreted peptide n=1 Tax=Anopheles braziliensis TaxID=58242 RepID=A0A2M3ZNR7_9DIPT
MLDGFLFALVAFLLVLFLFCFVSVSGFPVGLFTCMLSGFLAGFFLFVSRVHTGNHLAARELGPGRMRIQLNSSSAIRTHPRFWAFLPLFCLPQHRSSLILRAPLIFFCFSLRYRFFFFFIVYLSSIPCFYVSLYLPRGLCFLLFAK